ncbi:MAG: PilZ domain-containing protein [Planctomycetes bacterium]|nr:PilZ domain-containing protein [Planctomycetota bacterium]
MANSPIPVEGEFTLLSPKSFGRGLRRARRYRCPLATIGKIRFPDKDDAHEACVLNLSKTGIGLSLPEPLTVGCELALRLRISGEKTQRSFVLRVIHATQEADRSWRIGCAFDEPLSAELLELLLQ